MSLKVRDDIAADQFPDDDDNRATGNLARATVFIPDAVPPGPNDPIGQMNVKLRASIKAEFKTLLAAQPGMSQGRLIQVMMAAYRREQTGAQPLSADTPVVDPRDIADGRTETMVVPVKPHVAHKIRKRQQAHSAPSGALFEHAYRCCQQWDKKSGQPWDE